MREEYNFTDGKKNTLSKKLKKQITINITNSTIEYFKKESEDIGVPYQTLINLYLTDCAKNKRKLELTWGEN